MAPDALLMLVERVKEVGAELILDVLLATLPAQLNKEVAQCINGVVDIIVCKVLESPSGSRSEHVPRSVPKSRCVGYVGCPKITWDLRSP